MLRIQPNAVSEKPNSLMMYGAATPMAARSA